jgi:hypothetical protein
MISKKLSSEELEQLYMSSINQTEESEDLCAELLETLGQCAEVNAEDLGVLHRSRQ